MSFVQKNKSINRKRDTQKYRILNSKGHQMKTDIYIDRKTGYNFSLKRTETKENRRRVWDFGKHEQKQKWRRNTNESN